MAYETDPFGPFPGEQQAPQQAGRFNQMLHNPDMRGEARRIAANVGGDAIQGALQANNLVRDDGSIRKFRAARKLATNPTGLARKATIGAVQGARESGMQEVRGYAATAQEQAVNMAASQAQQAVEGGKKKWFGRGQTEQPQAAYAPAQQSFNDDPFGQPAAGYGNTMPARVGFPATASETFPSAGFPAATPNSYGSFPASNPNQFGAGPQGYDPNAFGGFPASPAPGFPAEGGFPH